MTDADGARDGESHRTGRWRGLGGATLAGGAVGLFARQSALLLATAVGVVLVAYARVLAAPAATLSATRTVDDPNPAPGDDVTVTLAVENTGSRPLLGVRLTDGVPPGWTVEGGAATRATALWPGETTTLEYTVTVGAASRGFDQVTAIVRDPVGLVEREVTVEAAGEVARTPLAATGDAPVLPVPATRTVGRDAVDASGEGVAFRARREYRHGDPLSRLDWRRLARTGDLATVTFRAERRLTVVLVVDARRAARLAPGPETPTAVQRSADAAARLAGSLTADGHRVGLAVLGPDRRWLPPGRGDAHRRRLRETLAATADGDRGGEDGDESAWLRARLPDRVTVVCLTPACDDALPALARRLHAGNTPTVVLSPDPTAADTAGRQLARIERHRRLRGLRASGLPVLDWAPTTDLATAVARAGWAR